MDNTDQDYLTDYRLFFDSIYESLDLADDPLPVHIGKYNVAEFEIVGEIICWCLEYLSIRNCPSSLIAPLCRSVIGEMEDVIRRDPESCGYRQEEDDYQTLKLMQVTIKKLTEVCLRYRDNSEVSRLPPPPPVPPSVSAAAVKNGRRTMEDSHIIIHDLHTLFGIQGYGVASYYAVFDGHIGSDAALYSCSHVYQYLMESPYYPSNPVAAFKEAFTKTDERFIDKSNKENLKSGTTAVSILIRHDLGKLYVAWLGDSQAILVNGRDWIQLVNPHRPEQVEERERIEKMGGSVVFWGTWRVNGQLAVSRAIGDVDYKPYVTADADVCSYDLSGDEDFLLLACDGLWDVLSEKDVVDEVYKCLQQNKGDRSVVSASLVQAAKSLGSKDNISVVVAWLDMSTLENGHFPAEARDVMDASAEDILLPPVLRSLKPALQPTIPAAHQRLDKSAEQWLKTLPWSYADAVKKPVQVKEEPSSPPTKDPASPPVESAADEVTSTTTVPDVCQEVPEARKEVPDVCQEVPIKSNPKGEEVGADAGCESGEDSDEEWNYVSGKENRQPNQHNKQELSEEDMESQLNPNAAEFVPVYGALDEDISHSPTKRSELRSLEKVKVPSVNEFLKDISKRPSDLDDLVGENDKTVNGDLTNTSTKAVFGDDSECLNATVDSSLLQNDSLKSTNPFASSQVPSFVQDHFSEDFGFKPLNDSQPDVFDLCGVKGGEQASPLLRESPEPGLHNGQAGSPSPLLGQVSSTSPHLGLAPSPLPDQGPETCVDSESEDDVLVSPSDKATNLKFEENFTQRLVDEVFRSEPAEEVENQFEYKISSEIHGNTVSPNELIDHTHNYMEVGINGDEKNNDVHLDSEIVGKEEQDVVCISIGATPMNAEQVVLGQSPLPVEEVCSKQEVQEDLISPVKEIPLLHEFLTKDHQEETQLENGLEFNSVPVSFGNVHNINEVADDKEEHNVEKENEILDIEDVKDENSVFSLEKEEISRVEQLIVKPQEEIEPICSIKKVEHDFELKNDDWHHNISKSNGVDTISPEDGDSIPHSPVDFSKIGQNQFNQISEENIFKTESNFVGLEDSICQKSLIVDSFSTFNNDEVCSFKVEKEVTPLDVDLVCYRNEENEIQPEDEMSSSMIDYGEDKTLPEAQSNQLNLVQDLQFEVQEKNEVDTESDSGFEIINASEASTIEMEMRIQSEKEAGAVDEKLLLDRNEAEVEEKVTNEVDETVIKSHENLVSFVDEPVLNEMNERQLEFDSSEKLLGQLENNVVRDFEEKFVSEQEEATNELEGKAMSELEEKVTSELEGKVLSTLEEQVMSELDEEVINNLETKITNELEEKMTNELEEKVTSELEEKVTSELEEKVTSELEEKVTSELEEKVTSELEEKVTSELEEKVTNELLEDKITSELEDKVTSELEEKVTSQLEEKVTSQLEEVTSQLEEKVTSQLEEKVISQLEEKVISQLEENITKEQEAIEVAVNGTATPPAALGKDDLSATDVAATGLVAVVAAGVAAVAVKATESKTEEKKKPASPKKVEPAGKVGIKAAPTKPTTTAKPTTSAKAAPSAAKAPLTKTTAKPASPITRTAAPARPGSATLKPAVTTAKPSTPTNKTLGTKVTSKPSTPTSAKPPVSSTALKSKPVAPPTAKPTSVAAKPAAPKPTATKPAVSATAKPSTTAKKPLTPTSSTAKPLPAKPTTTTAKPALTKSPITKAPATSTTRAPTAPTSRPTSAKSTTAAKPPVSAAARAPAKPSAPAKPATAKPATPTTRTTTTTTTAAKTAAAKPTAIKAPASKAAAPAAPLNKKPAAPTAIKKPAAPTDKSVKEANNKLASAKTVIKKDKIVCKKDEIIENVEPLTQEPIISTTNGHISPIENGIPTPETVPEVI